MAGALKQSSDGVDIVRELTGNKKTDKMIYAKRDGYTLEDSFSTLKGRRVPNMDTNGSDTSEHVATLNLNGTGSPNRDLLKDSIEEHLRDIGLWSASIRRELSKEGIREVHKSHKDKAHARIRKALGNERIKDFVDRYIANGNEIDLESIDPEVVLVNTDKLGEIFRFVTLFWSIPVSTGYGRRMRFIGGYVNMCVNEIRRRPSPVPIL